MDESSHLDKLGGDEADILIEFISEEGTRKGMTLERASPLHLLYSLRELFSKSSASFWLSPGYYPFRFDVRLLEGGTVVIEVHPPSYPLAEFKPRSDEDQLRLLEMLRTIADDVESISHPDGQSIPTRMPNFYLEQIEKLLVGGILKPPLFTSALSLEVPSLTFQVSVEAYVRAIKEVADAFFEAVSYEGALEETHQYKRYREGIAAYESWRNRSANSSQTA